MMRCEVRDAKPQNLFICICIRFLSSNLFSPVMHVQTSHQLPFGLANTRAQFTRTIL